MTDYLDPRVVSRIKGLEVRSMRLAESHMAGIHRSRLRGISTEFAQHRQYVVGDDTKHLDWKVFAKTDRLFVKEYEAETNLAVYFVLDMSPSMFFTSDKALLSKYDYAATIVACVSYILMQQKDTFGLTLFDEKPRTILPARGSGTHYRNVLGVLSKTKPRGEGKTSVGDALFAMSPMIKTKGIVVVLSDLLDESDNLAKALGQMSSIGQDVVIFHIEDAAERDFPFLGQSIFRGLENEGKLLCDPEDLRGSYFRERSRHIGEIRDAGMRFGYELVPIANDMRLDNVLSKLLTDRLARKRRWR